MQTRRSWILAALASTALACPAQAADEPRLTPAQLRQDLAAIEAVLTKDHPDLTHSADRTAVARQVRVIAERLDHPMTRDEAWREFATLNPVLADAHLSVGFADRRGDVKAHLAAGGRLFPFEVVATPSGELAIRAALGGGETPLRGARILQIDGRDAATVMRKILARMHGETAGLRANLASSRFAPLYWKVFGEPEAFDLVLLKDGRRQVLRVPGSRDLPANLAAEADFNRTYRFERLPCGGALLTVGAFYWPDKDAFLAFTRDAFARIKAEGVTTLIIDIRANEGGNDDMWRDGLLPYLATSRYQWASAFKKRVMTADPAKGEAVGDVVSGPLETWLDPDPGNPLRFSGKTYVLIGERTYSSAILFTNVVQHFGFAKVAGVGGLARADQSGGTRSTKLANSGLTVGWPRFILTHPSGPSAPEFVQPDVPIVDDPLRPRAAVDRLLACPVAD